MHFVHDLVQMTYITTIQNHSTGWEPIEKCSLHFDFSDVADLENRPRISTQVWLGEAQLRLWLHTFWKIFAFMSPGKNSKLKGGFPGPADYANIYHVAVTHTHKRTHLILNTAGGVGGGGVYTKPTICFSFWLAALFFSSSSMRLMDRDFCSSSTCCTVSRIFCRPTFRWSCCSSRSERFSVYNFTCCRQRSMWHPWNQLIPQLSACSVAHVICVTEVHVLARI